MKRFIEPLRIMQEHAAADRLIQGLWLRDKDASGIFRGCFFGCAAQSDKNPISKVCQDWGLPLWLGHLSEKVFEGLPEDKAKKWPVELLQALVDAPEDFNFRHAEAKINII